LKKYSVEELMNTNGNQLNRGVEILKKNMTYYNSKQIVTTTGEFIDNLNLAKGAMIENIETLLERNDRIDIIASKSNELTDVTNNISNAVVNLRNKESERKNKYIIYLIILLGLIIILYFLLRK
jgi:t-SNARE complex subunit (syntaxin)